MLLLLLRQVEIDGDDEWKNIYYMSTDFLSLSPANHQQQDELPVGWMTTGWWRLSSSV